MATIITLYSNTHLSDLQETRVIYKARSVIVLIYHHDDDDQIKL